VAIDVKLLPLEHKIPAVSSPSLPIALTYLKIMTPDKEDLWFVPLGGSGEIGMNLNLYGHDGQWLIVDCGLTFSDKPTPATSETTPDITKPPTSKNTRRDVQMADPAFIAERASDIAGLIITHAHEDHVGAVAYLWPQLRCPVYTTAFTAYILRRKLAEANLLDDVDLRIVEASESKDIGPFNVEWIAMTHSTAEPCGLFITTAAGTVFHTGDWKLDPQPVVGDTFNGTRCRELGAQTVDAMVCDSTNANVAGSTPSESELYDGLKALISNAPGRVVVTCFGSNLARVSTLAQIAADTDRHVGMIGRSMINMVNAGRATGLLTTDISIVEASHLGYLPPESVLLLATGSQGEPRTALHRLSTNTFRDMELEPSDTVIFSSRVIPGNEDSIAAITERLESMGVTVFGEHNVEALIHVSGHPAAEDLETMYEWVKPDLVIPVHGEAEHMQANTELAKKSGVPRQIQGTNGDLFIIAPNKAIRRNAVPVGRLTLQGRKLVAVNE